MVSIRSYIFSGSLILMGAGIWGCGRGAGKGNARAPEADTNADDHANSGAYESSGMHANADSQLVKFYPDGDIHRNDDKERKMVRLADGTEILLGSNTEIRVSKEFNKAGRGLVLNGEAFFNVPGDATKPFIIHTRNLQIQVLGTRFRVDAFAANAGEEVDLLSGRLKVIKSYHSTTDNEPEILEAGDMVMINRDIDLMEKEKMDSAERKKCQW